MRSTPETKACRRCGRVKAVDEFALARKRRDGRQDWCRSCSNEVSRARYADPEKRENYLAKKRERYQRNAEENRAKKREQYYADPAKANAATRRSMLKRLYGLTWDEYEEMVALQGGRCLVCGETPERTLHVDHCHSTGRVRGLLCSSCNTGIGLFKDSVERLMAAAVYLETFALASAGVEAEVSGG